MGLAVSQVRLLALTNRKADIECQMQIDSKRKMMLTRKSTELAQQYYSKLQCANIQYATSNGYEDVDFSYLMGQTVNNMYTAGFLDQVAFGNSYEIPQKTQNKMILTNQYGEVVVNDLIAKVTAQIKDDFNNYDITRQTAEAVLRLIDITHEEGMVNTESFAAFYDLYHDYIKHIDPTGTDGRIGKDNLIKYMTAILDNGGLKDGGVIFSKTSGANVTYYSDIDGTIPVIPASGTCYRVGNADTHAEASTDSVFFYGENGASAVATNFTKQYATKIANLCSYFGPMLSAAIQNGTSTKVERIEKTNTFNYDLANKKLTVGSGTIDFSSGGNETATDIMASLRSEGNLNKVFGTSVGSTSYVTVADKNGNMHYFEVEVLSSAGNVKVTERKEGEISSLFYDQYIIKDDTNFLAAMNKEKLQSGFRSGLFQLAMVDDIGKGNYHKNTTLEYFTHMNYVVEKTDSSKREEITAWFNAENAAISEKETYWDTEIQNLSTELNSVTTEIDSVKQLKSNAIKSVFNWGGN